VDQTLSVLVKLMAGGDLAGQLKQQQKALAELDRTQDQLTQGQRQQFQQARSNAALGAALVVGQIAGTRAAVAGLQQQQRHQTQIVQVQQRQIQQQRILTTQARDGARGMPTTTFSLSGESPAAAAVARRRATAELERKAFEDQQAARKAGRGFQRRATELTAGPGETGIGMQQALEKSFKAKLAVAPHREQVDLIEAQIRATTEAKLLRGREPGYQRPLGSDKLGKHAEALENAMYERLTLANRLTDVDRQKLIIQNRVLHSEEAQTVASHTAMVEAQRAVGKARQREMMATEPIRGVGRNEQAIARADLKMVAAAEAKADDAEAYMAARRRVAAANARGDFLAGPAGQNLARRTTQTQLAAQYQENMVRVDESKLRRDVIGRPFFKEVAYTAVKAARSEEVTALKESTVLAQQKAKWMASPSGQKLLREEAKLQKELAAAQRQQRLGELTTQYGQFGGRVRLLGEDFAKLGVNLQQLGTQLQYAFAGGVAGMAALVNAASPSHFATITGSITLLAQSLGESLLPYADELSLRLQQASRWIRSLSPEAKNAAAQFAIWGIGIIGVTAILIKLGGAALSAAAALKALGASTALSLAPAVGVVALLAAGVAALGVAWYMASQQTTAAVHDMTAASGALQKVQSGGASQAEMLGILGPEVEKRLAAQAGNRAKQAEIFKEAADAAAAEAEGRRKTLGDEALAYKKASEMFAAQYALAGQTFGAVGPGPREDINRILIENLKKLGVMPPPEAAKLFDVGPLGISTLNVERFKRFQELPEIQLKEAEAKEAAAKKLAATGLAGPEEVQRSLRGLPAPAYLQAAQLAEKFQLKLLEPKGPLDREIEINQLRAIKDLLLSIDNKVPKGGNVPLFGVGTGVTW
jgi:hypothetical protein